MRLAIDGGKPVRSSRLPYGQHWLDKDDRKAVEEVLKGPLIAQGPKVEELEKEIAKYCNASFAVAMSSGTTALHAACVVAGIGTGDEVIVPPLTFVATANAIIYCGGTPVFADIDSETLNIDPKEIGKAMTAKTKAIMPVDFAGLPCDYPSITELLTDQIVIQDACHALGSDPPLFMQQRHRGGLWGDMTIFSTHPVKPITTGEGGFIVTNDEEYNSQLRILRNQGLLRNLPNKPHWYYEVRSLGFNYRMTDFQAALGLSQFQKLGRFIVRRQKIASMYDAAFQGIPQIIRPVLDTNHHAYHLYIIQLELEQLKADRDQIASALYYEGIDVNVHYRPLHLQPFYQKYGYKKGDFPVSERYYERCITLPIFPKMKHRDINDVIEATQKVIGYYAQ